MGPAALFAILVFSLAAAFHLLRLILQIEVVVGGAVIPMWVSVVGVVVAAALAAALWKEAGPDLET